MKFRGSVTRIGREILENKKLISVLFINYLLALNWLILFKLQFSFD